MEKQWLRSRKPRLTAVGIRSADHATPSVLKKLALTSPTSGGPSVGIVRLRTKSHGIYFYLTGGDSSIITRLVRLYLNSSSYYQHHYRVTIKIHTPGIRTIRVFLYSYKLPRKCPFGGWTEVCSWGVMKISILLKSKMMCSDLILWTLPIVLYLYLKQLVGDDFSCILR
jgi:hypothetical protein